ncbi:tetratricopeptide repeat protein [Roseomonas fluvialis]|uniref:Tetratricopeptide repeat protein n=1 Tax=Roseomonas fluvialis TaxID=1750527 RepID=A0ABM7Y1A6_9PROT|nr:tetratricopeptide repeat protein [Roseomonas fluvialis]BDG71552.1 hypothetical protein Rmf_14810 [Roseomonas fluvialis]
MTVDIPGMLAAARAARRNREFDAAVTLFDRILEQQPGNMQARLERIGTLTQSGQADSALPLIAAVLAEHPNNHHAHLEAAWAKSARGRPAEALAHFDIALPKLREPHRILVPMANQARAAGQHARALDLARAATEHDPAAIPAWNALAAAAKAAGDADTEHQALRQVASLDATAAAPLVALAQAARARDDLVAAHDLLDQAEARDPAAPAISLLRGWLWFAERVTDQAADCFTEALQRDPGLANAASGLAQCHLRDGAPDAAAAVLDAAEARLGPRPDFIGPRAQLLRARGEVAAALALLREAALAQSPVQHGRWEAWARLALVLGDSAERAACLAAAPEASPAERHARLMFAARSAEAELDFAAADEAFAAALAIDAADSAALDGRARIAALNLDDVAARGFLAAQAQAEAALRRRQGRSLNPSQTDTGQIALEFRLDQPGAAALRDLLPLAPTARILPLIDRVRRLPDSTATALWLLLSLVQSGALARPRAQGSAVPARLLLVVPRGAPGEADAQAWQRANPGVDVVAMDREAGAAFIDARLGQAGRRAWARAWEGSVRADLLRLAWIATVGGWTVAPGARPAAPIATLAAGGADLVATPGLWGAPQPLLFGAAAGHPVARRAVDRLIEALARGDEEHPWLRSGPGFLARALAGALAEAPGLAEAIHLAPGHAVQAVVQHDWRPEWNQALF